MEEILTNLASLIKAVTKLINVVTEQMEEEK